MDIYTVGFPSVYLFLNDVGVLDASKDNKIVGVREDGSYRLQVLNQLSLSYSKIIQIEKQVKGEIIKLITGALQLDISQGVKAILLDNQNQSICFTDSSYSEILASNFETSELSMKSI